LENSSRKLENSFLEVAEKETLFKKSVLDLEIMTKDLEGWAAEKEAEQASSTAAASSDAAGANIARAHSMLVPSTVLSEQFVRLSSQFDAIDDALYYLDRALSNNDNASVDLTTFMKTTRNLNRNQFLLKAHMKKVKREIQASV
jgi:hypothetical protein